MGGTADRLKKLGLVDEVLKEPNGAAHRDPQAMAEAVKQSMIKHLTELSKQPITTLLDARQARLRGFGVFAADSACASARNCCGPCSRTTYRRAPPVCWSA